MNTLNDFLTYFNLDTLLTVTSETSMIEVIVMMFIAFISTIFFIVGIRIVMEIVKIIVDYKRWV